MLKGEIGEILLLKGEIFIIRRRCCFRLWWDCLIEKQTLEHAARLEVKGREV